MRLEKAGLTKKGVQYHPIAQNNKEGNKRIWQTNRI